MLSSFADTENEEGSKDPTLFNRMPGYNIYRYTIIEAVQ
jgi:hypothetical protein